MMITKGKVLIIECGFEKSFKLERDSRKPGIVALTKQRGAGDGTDYIELPGNKVDAQYLIDAYSRIVNEDMGYTPSKHESNPDCEDKNLSAKYAAISKLSVEDRIEVLDYAIKRSKLSLEEED